LPLGVRVYALGAPNWVATLEVAGVSRGFG